MPDVTLDRRVGCRQKQRPGLDNDRDPAHLGLFWSRPTCYTVGVGKRVNREVKQSSVADEGAPDLMDLAREIQSLPEIKPRSTWMRDAKRRLLRRFDDYHTPGREHPQQDRAD